MNGSPVAAVVLLAACAAALVYGSLNTSASHVLEPGDVIVLAAESRAVSLLVCAGVAGIAIGAMLMLVEGRLDATPR